MLFGGRFNGVNTRLDAQRGRRIVFNRGDNRINMRAGGGFPKYNSRLAAAVIRQGLSTIRRVALSTGTVIGLERVVRCSIRTIPVVTPLHMSVAVTISG